MPITFQRRNNAIEINLIATTSHIILRLETHVSVAGRLDARKF